MNDEFLWGDEIEYTMVKMDYEKRKAFLSLCYEDVIKNFLLLNDNLVDFKPEYARYMIEGTPKNPYTSSIRDLLNVEKNMNHRRKILQSILPKNNYVITTVTYPHLGVGKFTTEETTRFNPLSLSKYYSDNCINKHPRFATLTNNTVCRRKEKIKIEIPIYKDINTKEDIIEMDAYGYGMGSCCLQVTFQTKNISEARYLHDQLTVLAPLVLSMTASSPIWHGRLSDYDVRWKVLSQSCDDRTKGERGESPLVL